MCDRFAEASRDHEKDVDEAKLREKATFRRDLRDLITHLDDQFDGRASKKEFDRADRFDLVAGLGLPEGFIDHELLRMVDQDRFCWVGVEEFGTTIMRLMHCNDFQGVCGRVPFLRFQACDSGHGVESG